MAELKRREKDIEFQNKITLAITDHDSDHEYFLMSFKWRWRWWWKDLFQMMGRSPPHEVEVGKRPGKKCPRHYHPWQCNEASGHVVYLFWSLPRIHAWSLLSSWRSQFKTSTSLLQGMLPTWKLQTLSGEGVYLHSQAPSRPPGLLVNVALELVVLVAVNFCQHGLMVHL